MVLPGELRRVSWIWFRRSLDAAGTEAGAARRAVGRVHRSGLHQGRMSATGVQLLPGGFDAGAGEVVRRTGREHVLRRRSVGAYEGDSPPSSCFHGPGYGKVLIGDDMDDRVERFVDLMAGFEFPRDGRRFGVDRRASGSRRRTPFAWRSARLVKLAAIVPRKADDEQALLAPFADPRVAERISHETTAALPAKAPRRHRVAPIVSAPTPRSTAAHISCRTVLLCRLGHPLAIREFPLSRLRRG